VIPAPETNWDLSVVQGGKDPALLPYKNEMYMVDTRTVRGG